MNKYIKFIFSIVVALFFIGCSRVQPPTQAQIGSADYGTYPNTYKEIVTEYITASLIDPTSAIFSNWRSPEKGWYQPPFKLDGKVYYGYKVCVDVNGKNRMGGYTGASPFFAVIYNNRIIYLDDASSYTRGTVGE